MSYERKFKNPALRYVNGVITGHCIVCGEYIGNEHDTDYYSLIKRKRCPECAEKVERENARFRAANNKHNHKLIKAAWQTLIDEYRAETTIQRQIINEQRNELEMLRSRTKR